MSIGISTEVRGTAPSESFSDSAFSYLQERDKKDDFIMVEFGHDARPVAYRQSRPFTNGRAYIGYEAWLRDPEGRKIATVQARHEQHQGHLLNVHYQTLALGGMVRSVTEDGETEKWFEGAYDPHTPLPDASIDEVFLSNVFGDPYIADVSEHTNTLLSEATRILADDGTLIVRETLTPYKTRGHFETSIAAQGLTTRARISPSDKAWHELEAQFSNDRSYALGSFYLLLTK